MIHWCVRTCSSHASTNTHIVGSLLNSLANLSIETVRDVHHRGSLLQDTKRLDQRLWQPLRWATNVKVLQGTVS